ncbi:MAG: Uncharacterised protein [Methanobacteriota archaeon]|nr:MAG: Uncharacterised protein [Euryarchaeota archaeon]
MLVVSQETPVEKPVTLTVSAITSDQIVCNPIDVESDHWAS